MANASLGSVYSSVSIAEMIWVNLWSKYIQGELNEKDVPYGTMQETERMVHGTSFQERTHTRCPQLLLDVSENINETFRVHIFNSSLKIPSTDWVQERLRGFPWSPFFLFLLKKLQEKNTKEKENEKKSMNICPFRS